MIKFCKKCKKNNIIQYDGVGGYYWSYLDTAKVCNECGTEFENVDFSAQDLKILTLISQDVHFIEAMIDLKEKDIIEYNLKMGRFKTQAQQIQQLDEQQENNLPKCPTCGSTNLKRISGLSKAGSVAMWGFLSRKVHKQWHCNNCGSEW